MRENGIAVDDDIVFCVPPKEKQGFEYTCRILEKKPPTALIAGNNLLGSGALSAIRAANLTIPDDIQLTVFDDPSWTSLVSPPLTVVSQPTYALGRTAAELLLRRINEPDGPIQEVVLKSRLIVRS
jgi:LacI family fructose operon transcriptional repressor